MIIGLVDCDSGLDKKEILGALEAINVQLRRDLKPHWHLVGKLRMEEKRGDELWESARKGNPAGLIYLLSESRNTDGFHITRYGIPYGAVPVLVRPQQLTANPWMHWTVALSHEALEMIADPWLNLTVVGPDPRKRERQVFHYREICDPVQGDTYQINGVGVSNFVTPKYYTIGDRPGDRNDFNKRGVDSFSYLGEQADGYCCCFDPEIDPATGKYRGYFTFPNDPIGSSAAEQRRTWKLDAGRTSRRAEAAGTVATPKRPSGVRRR